MKHSDLLIVGGGPAGSSLAWALKGSGLSIRVLDKQPFPRDKICAGWVTPAVFESLLIEPADYAQAHILQPITGFRIGLMKQPMIESAPSECTISYGIRRCEFDDYLLQRCGATVETGVATKTIRREQGRWILNNAYSADLLVGAGGHFCPVARHLGARLGQSEPSVSAKEVEFPMSLRQQSLCKVREEIPELYFCEDLKGYAWIFRKGRYLNIGLGRSDNVRLNDHLQQFVAALQCEGRIPADLPNAFKGHAYVLYDHGIRDVIGSHALLIGDAAGLAYTQSGEGIRPAVESAFLAAKSILGAAGD
jgi:menaquinone-9 beta-reductase